MDAINAPTIAGGSQHPVRRPRQRIENVIVPTPDLARRPAAMRDCVELRAFGDERVAVEGLHGSRRDNGDSRRHRCLPGNRQRRQVVSPLLAHAGGIDRPIGRNNDRGDLLPRCVVQHESLPRRIDAIDEPRAVGSGDQIARLIEGQRANVLLIAFVKQLRFVRAVPAPPPLTR